MDRETQVRAEHPDWTDEQVAAELARLTALDPPVPKPDPDDRDAAFARLRREKEAAEKAAKDARDALAAKERTEAEQAGEWQKLAQQYEQERDDARAELEQLRQQIKVEAIATRLKFRNADEALAVLRTSQPELDMSDEAAVTKALEALAENRPHLVDNGKPGPTGLPPAGPNAGLTIDQIKAMSPDEVNKRWDEIQPVLAQQKS